MPLIGWCWLFTESIFINRKWETDKKLLVEGLDKNLTDYPEDCYFNVKKFILNSIKKINFKKIN
jgi:hypothetical protein